MSAFAASIMVIGVGLSQVTAADLVPLRPHIERIADQEPALIVDALAAGIQALPNAATRNAFADAFAKTAGLDRIDLTADPAFQRDVEVVRGARVGSTKTSHIGRNVQCPRTGYCRLNELSRTDEHANRVVLPRDSAEVLRRLGVNHSTLSHALSSFTRSPRGAGTS